MTAGGDSDGRDPERNGPPGGGLTEAERKAAQRRADFRRKRRLIRTGQVLMVLGGLVGFVHLLAHLEVFGGQPSGVVDLLVGYPMAGLVFLAGAVLAGQ